MHSLCFARLLSYCVGLFLDVNGACGCASALRLNRCVCHLLLCTVAVHGLYNPSCRIPPVGVPCKLEAYQASIYRKRQQPRAWNLLVECVFIDLKYLASR